MRTTVLVVTVFAVTGSAFVAAADPNMPYSPTPERPVTGTMIERSVVGSHIPLNRSYAELSPEQQLAVKANYANLGPSDEPPYPLNGLKSVAQRIANADVAASVDGELVVRVDVSSSGVANSATVVQTPNVRVAEIAATALQHERYKPALCHGQPCAMPFVYRVQLSSPR